MLSLSRPVMVNSACGPPEPSVTRATGWPTAPKRPFGSSREVTRRTAWTSAGTWPRSTSTFQPWPPAGGTHRTPGPVGWL